MLGYDINTNRFSISKPTRTDPDGHAARHRQGQGAVNGPRLRVAVVNVQP
jgi:hypothetical protein